MTQSDDAVSKTDDFEVLGKEKMENISAENLKTKTFWYWSHSRQYKNILTSKKWNTFQIAYTAN